MAYTPSTEEVRVAFDRWLAAHDAEVRADERARIAEAIWESPMYRTAEARELIDPNAYTRRCAYDYAAQIAEGS